MTEIPRLPEEVRAGLPVEVQAYIAGLEALVGELQVQVGTLQGQVSELEVRVRQTSRNSSRPPSSDPPSAPSRPRRAASSRKRGGQRGHPRHERKLLPVSEVDEVVEHRPLACPHCHKELVEDLPDATEPKRQQVWEVPEVKPHVTEHRYHRVSCPGCGTVVEAGRPAGVPEGAFGARLVALVGLLHGRYRLSVREIVALLLDVFGLPISPGSVIDLCQLLSRALATAHADGQEAVAAASSSNVDETGWKQAGQRRWLWVAVTGACTIFMITTQRNGQALKALLGNMFRGIVTSDRFRTYLTLPIERRQVCWAHLKRNWQAFSERDGAVGKWGQQAIESIERLFDFWHRFRAGAWTRRELQAHMRPVQVELRRLLEQGHTLPLTKAQTFSREVWDLWPALWTFLYVEGIEPTNNAAERALRPAVLWRKGCFGTQSDAGDMFAARILSVVATCRQQEHHLLTFLTNAVRAYQAGQPTPTLCPTP